MKKKCLYSLLTILGTIMLIGCNSSEPSEEASEPTSVAQGNALESAFLSEDHFELREESITIEYGTPLSDDISEYVIAKDYEGITCEYEEIRISEFRDGATGTATFTNTAGEKLSMTVMYTDTTSPTIEQTDYTYYTLHQNGPYTENLILLEVIAPEKNGGEKVFLISNFYDYFGIKDNVYCHDVSFFSINGNSFELDDQYSSLTVIPALNYGDYAIVITVNDYSGHTETFECTLHIVADVSPEEREQLISEGYTEEQINTAVEEFVNQNQSK